MNKPTLIHPKLMSMLTPVFYSDQLTVQEKTGSRDSAGGIVESWSDVPAWIDLACSIAPTHDESVTGVDEQRHPELTVSTDLLTVSLPQYLPTLTREYRAVIDSEPWNILGVQWDSHQTMTRLALEKVKR